jgi:hypothetical protein
MTEAKYKILADVVISGGDVNITNIEPINYPSSMSSFTITLNDDEDDNILEPITNKITGKYNFFNNFFINNNNVIIQFVNNKWTVSFIFRFSDSTELYFIYFTNEKSDDEKITYMNIKDLNKLFQKGKGTVNIIHKSVNITKTTTEPTFKTLIKDYNWKKFTAK